MHSCDTWQTHHSWTPPTPWHKQRAEEPLCKGKNFSDEGYKKEGYMYHIDMPVTFRMCVCQDNTVRVPIRLVVEYENMRVPIRLVAQYVVKI